MDQRIKSLLPYSKYLSYLNWREKTDRKENDLSFLFTVTSKTKKTLKPEN